MSLSNLTVNNEDRSKLEKIQQSVFAHHGRALLDESDQKHSMLNYDDYFKGDPQQLTDEKKEMYLAEHAKRVGLPNRPDIGRIGSTGAVRILESLVDRLKAASKKLNPEWTLDSICFGLVPAGGLDAHALRLSHDSKKYAVLIPEGLFDLANLFTKLVLLLQPISETSSGSVYLPTASFDQLGLINHPYIKFRQRDLWRGYFIHGDPGAALPYMRTIRYSEKLEYLLTGTELYVLAHEVAHILLGHLSSDLSGKEIEFEADSLALKIVEEFFRAEMDFEYARASLSAFTFLAINAIWERAIMIAIRSKSISKEEDRLERIHKRIAGIDDPEINKSHPGAWSRFRNFAQDLASDRGKTPGWYIHIHNAIRFASDEMSEDLIKGIVEEAGGISGLSTRVLPSTFIHEGHTRVTVREDVWWKTIAELLTAKEKKQQLLGRWLLVQLSPYSALGLYKGLESESKESAELFKKALVSIQPLYENDIPRLKERFRETAREDQEQIYRLNIASYLTAQVVVELGEDRAQGTPMDPGFFERAEDSLGDL